MLTSRLGYDVLTVEVLWRRAMLRLLHQPGRVALAAIAPLGGWVLVGLGLGQALTAEGSLIDYRQFAFPGATALVVLWASATLTTVDPTGLEQTALASPASRGAVALGRCLGVATAAFVVGQVPLAVAPAANFSLGRIDWPLWLAASSLTAILLATLCSCSGALAGETRRYRMLILGVLVPLWMLSDALFPLTHAPWLVTALVMANPCTYAVATLRAAYHGSSAPPLFAVPPAPALASLALFALVGLALAVLCESTRRGRA